MKKATRAVTALATTAVIAAGSLGLASTASDMQPAAGQEMSAILHSPLIEGPLVDVGGILNSPQFGQFQ